MSTQSNPFATRFIRPGAIEYIFPVGQSAELLVSKLRENDWRGQIIGPHGSGKSTLLAALVPPLLAAGRKVWQLKIQNSEFRIQNLESQLGATTQLVVDGFEQLSWWLRKQLQDKCRRCGAGLLVTAHRDLGLPTLLQTQSTLELARAVVARLLPSGDSSIKPDDVACSYETANREIRETLFTLYDVYQQRQAATIQAGTLAGEGEAGSRSADQRDDSSS